MQRKKKKKMCLQRARYEQRITSEKLFISKREGSGGNPIQ
jgi:hypothetical protein